MKVFSCKLLPKTNWNLENFSKYVVKQRFISPSDEYEKTWSKALNLETDIKRRIYSANIGAHSRYWVNSLAKKKKTNPWEHIPKKWVIA